MLFNSIEFLIYLIVIYFIYWFALSSNLKLQNLMLLLGSYFFYGWWDVKFLFLLAFSTGLDFYSGINIFEAKTRLYKKIWLITSVGINVSFLGVFKYYNFFIESFGNLISLTGLNIKLWTLKVIIPVGISFYTFHGLSYIFDIYNNKIKPERNLINYSLFVSFFPLLVAGPIERATHLLPQITKKRTFNYEESVDGLRQILWGLFKKIVIADNCATIVNQIFDDYSNYNSSTLIIGTILFSFQIYGDFSGYSDIALGTAKLLGFRLLKNFAYPYFSRDIAEFWRRWHISLSSWFKDYIYIPLGGSKISTMRKIRNTFVIFLLSGFWHGANWTFIFWGGLNAFYFLPLLLRNKNRAHISIVAENSILPSFYEFSQIILTFSLTCIAWVFFRANSLFQALQYLKSIFIFKFSGKISPSILPISLFILLLIIVEWIGRKNEYALENFFKNSNRFFTWSFYYFIIILIVLNSGKEQDFIYFQF